MLKIQDRVCENAPKRQHGGASLSSDTTISLNSSTAAEESAYSAVAISLRRQRLVHDRERCMLARQRVHDRKRVRREQAAAQGVCPITVHSELSSQRARSVRERTGGLLASATGSVERLGRACDRAHALDQRCGTSSGHKDLRRLGAEKEEESVAPSGARGDPWKDPESVMVRSKADLRTWSGMRRHR